MQKIFFLFPNLSMQVGGNIAQYKIATACSEFASVEIVTYRERIEHTRYLDDLLVLSELSEDKPIFVIHWGPDVQGLVDRLAEHDVVYVAHSTGWFDRLPPRVPIICVSRNTLGFWGRNAPNSLISYVPNIVSVPKRDQYKCEVRDIDVLVQRRKSSDYLLNSLVPALRERCNLVLLDGWVDDLGEYFCRSKVYLYDSSEHWIQRNATEGFGLPPLEAMAFGCVVFSSINDALSDYLDPGINCRKIRVYSTEFDVEAIIQAVSEREPRPKDDEFLSHYSSSSVSMRLKNTFSDCVTFFKATREHTSNIKQPRRHRSIVERAKLVLRFPHIN